MAGDWIKIRHALPRSGKVVRIMSACDADKLRTIGGLVSAILLFDEQTDSGFLDGYTLKAFDEIIGMEGLGAALCDEKVGWMEQNEDGLTLLEWDKHNGTSAKRRLNDAERKRISRAQESCPQNVQKKMDTARTDSGPEKRREEKNVKITPHPAREDENFSGSDPGSVIIPPCSLSDARYYAATIGMAEDVAALWWEKRDAEDWRPRPGEFALTTKSWKIELKQYHFNKTRIENERRRNQKTGSGAVGKASENPRNGHLPAGVLDEYQLTCQMEDIRDELRRLAGKRPDVAKFIRERHSEHSQYPRAIQWLREHREGIYEGVFDRLAELGFIDVQSGRWIGPDS
jgi:hypothetical protein